VRDINAELRRIRYKTAFASALGWIACTIGAVELGGWGAGAIAFGVPLMIFSSALAMVVIATEVATKVGPNG